MSDIEFRFGKKRFYDNSKFPRGFAKSGDFTLAEEELLTLYGDTMKALESGEITPENAEEKQFVKALKSPQKAKSKLEKVWLKYIQLTRGKKRFHSLSSSTRPRSDQRPSAHRYSTQEDALSYDTDVSLDDLSLEEEELSQSNLNHSTQKSTQAMEHP
ncbi:DUF413 domain-containing protein [Vibrio sp. 10N.261.55.A7]|uniref:DUF413 domain-containing protein n=1 Tax=Vibrio sp. 10N.261.55.A7 TaxID=1880851 RepID=UPI000C856B7A|nr:DUF413 domain-containing protein [Vibrio sp. 10N.261.55.A7]PMK02439.1 hypothetical protein BCU12_18420 [Vibrio sp. 10N.261.55.A7]